MSGEYKNYSEFQKEGNSKCLSYLKNCISQMNELFPERFKNSKDIFVVQDLGTADGLNSIPNFIQLINSIREINPDMPIHFVLNDLEHNNFSEALSNVENGLKMFNNIFVSAVARSFYTQTLPPNTVDLSISINSVHWLPQAPAIHDNFHFYFTKEMENNETNEKWLKSAEFYWEKFLSVRKTELKKNGFILVSTLCTKTNLSEDDKKLITFYREVKRILKDLLKKYNLLDKEISFTLPFAVRQQEQFLNPFSKKSTSLGLISYSEIDIINPFYRLFLEDKNEERYAKNMLGFIQAYSLNAINFGLKNELNLLESEIFIKEFYGERFIDLLKENLKNLFLKITYAIIVIKK